MARIVVIHEQDVVEPAGDDPPRERAQPGEPALALIVVQAGMAKARGRVPAARPPLVLAIGDVVRAVDEDGEAQPRPGPNLEQRADERHVGKEGVSTWRMRSSQ